MKIGIDGRLLDLQHNTGISRYTEFLIIYYINRYGVENVYVLTNDSSLRYNNCKMIYTTLKPFNIFHFTKYAKFVSLLDVEILHIPFYSGLSCKIKKPKVIVTVHDLMYKLVENFFGNNKCINCLKRFYFDFILRCTLHTADVIVAVSKTTQQDLYNLFHSVSIYIPEFSEICTDSSDLVLEKLELKKKNFFFYCGNNRPHKNLQFVIDIFNSLPELPQLVLAGVGHEDSLNVKTVGVVSESTLRTLYQASIAFIFPSKYEGFGLPVLEALNSKTLVVASKISAFLEFESENIIFFELGNREQFIMALYEATQKTFVEETDFFKKYSVDNIYKQLDEMLSHNRLQNNM